MVLLAYADDSVVVPAGSSLKSLVPGRLLDRGLVSRRLMVSSRGLVGGLLVRRWR